MDSVKVTMIDGTVGNDYSVSLCSNLSAVGVNIELIVPENRIMNVPPDYVVEYCKPFQVTDAYDPLLAVTFPIRESSAAL